MTMETAQLTKSVTSVETVLLHCRSGDIVMYLIVYAKKVQSVVNVTTCANLANVKSMLTVILPKNNLYLVLMENATLRQKTVTLATTTNNAIQKIAIKILECAWDGSATTPIKNAKEIELGVTSVFAKQMNHVLVLLVQLTQTVNLIHQGPLQHSCNVTSTKLNASMYLKTEELVIQIFKNTQSNMNVKIMMTVQVVGVILETAFLTIQKELMKKNQPHPPLVRLVPQPPQQQIDSIL